jgi:hypothetical protein
MVSDEKMLGGTPLPPLKHWFVLKITGGEWIICEFLGRSVL